METTGTFLRLFILLTFMYRVQCGCSVTHGALTATDNVQYIHSANYPSVYPNNEDCRWRITVSSPKTIFFNVEYSSLESGYDFSRITDGTGSTLYSSRYHNSPHTGVSGDQTLVVTFTSDSSITYNGIYVTFVAVDRSALNCGNTLTASSTEQQISYISSQEGPCSYRINAASPSNIIQIVVKILEDNQVDVAEGGVTTLVITYGSTSTYLSSSDSITVTPGADFVMTYIEVTTAVTASVVTSSSIIGTSICDTSHLNAATSTANYINSPNYPNGYQHNMYCTITITAYSTSDSVFIEVLDWNVDTFDIVALYDGPDLSYNLVTTTWNVGDTHTSTASSFTIVFYSDSTVSYRGFSIKYTQTSRVPPSCTSSNFKTASTVSDSITSPNYPSNYDNYAVEYTTITKPSETDTIVLIFRTMDLEDSSSCQYDSITIYDGPCTTSPVIAVICGRDLSTFEDQSGLYILIKFKTDGSITRSGFEMEFYIGSVGYAESSEEDESGVPSFVYGVVVALVVLIVVVISVCCLSYRARKRNHRVAATGGIITNPPPLKRKTTQQLVAELRSRYASGDKKQPKVKRKEQNQYHLIPNPPGPGANVINMRAQSPHPPPGPPPMHNPNIYNDPAYPPALLGGGGLVNPEMPKASVAPGGTIVPSAPPSNIFVSEATLPQPFKYITPAEARANGTYGAG